MDEIKIKKTKGRQKIEIKKIEKKTRLQVAFTKRRNGLFKKARELNILCGAQVAIIALSPGNKFFAFESSSEYSVLDHFKREEVSLRTIGDINTMPVRKEREMKYCTETVRKVERKKNMNVECEQGNAKFYWDIAIDNMELDELEVYSKSLHELKNNILNRMNELDNLSSSSNLLTLSNQDSEYKFDGSLSHSQILDLDDFSEDHSLVLEDIRAGLMGEVFTQELLADLMDEEYSEELRAGALMVEEYTQELPAALMDEEYSRTRKEFDKGV